jgi:selenide,water dikinase
LVQVLSQLPKQDMTNVIVGYETADDAGVFRLSDEMALVQTVDFFTPVADDPEIYGRIAAINSLNDIYAMGGKPLTALSIVCYPQKGDWDVLGEILSGGQKTLNAESVVVLGGHSVDDQEIKFGYSVTGIIHPKKVITNAGAQAGDVLIITKPIGTGAINTAVKRGVAREATAKAAIRAMTSSARIPSEIMQKVGVNSCTDVTGFGLLGHTFEMALASNVTIQIDSNKVPLLPDVLELISEGMLTRGDVNNRKYVGETVVFDENVKRETQSALFDPQTAGGLLISLEKERAVKFISEFSDAVIIGEVRPKTNYLIEVF